MKINTPTKNKDRNVRSYFSGLYQCYRVNVQFVFDHLCRSKYFAVAAAGNIHDNVAIKECSLWDIISNLPFGYVIIAHVANAPIEQLILLYYGDDRTIDKYDNFNVYGSQCRIRS